MDPEEVAHDFLGQIHALTESARQPETIYTLPQMCEETKKIERLSAKVSAAIQSQKGHAMLQSSMHDELTEVRHHAYEALDGYKRAMMLNKPNWYQMICEEDGDTVVYVPARGHPDVLVINISENASTPHSMFI